MERDSITQKLNAKITKLEQAAGKQTNQSKELRRQLIDREEYLRRTGQANIPKPARQRNSNEGRNR